MLRKIYLLYVPMLALLIPMCSEDDLVAPKQDNSPPVWFIQFTSPPHDTVITADSMSVFLDTKYNKAVYGDQYPMGAGEVGIFKIVGDSSYTSRYLSVSCSRPEGFCTRDFPMGSCAWKYTLSLKELLRGQKYYYYMMLINYPNVYSPIRAFQFK